MLHAQERPPFSFSGGEASPQETCEQHWVARYFSLPVASSFGFTNRPVWTRLLDKLICPRAPDLSDTPLGRSGFLGRRTLPMITH